MTRAALFPGPPSQPWLCRASGLTLALEAGEVYERLGSPEGELAIAQAVVFLACAAKSNAVYVAFGEAMGDAKSLGSLEVPLHLRNAPTRLMKQLGYGKDYRYAHDEPDAHAAGEHYFPEGLQSRQYYRPVPRGLEIKIAEALETAHEKGVIHRDLKPANIKLTSEDQVKVLDFGLAKNVASPRSGDPTHTAWRTEIGTIMGTPAYMSPEQARGEDVRRQSDIWSLGVMLYEMLTGRSHFAADTTAETLARVLDA